MGYEGRDSLRRLYPKRVRGASGSAPSIQIGLDGSRVRLQPERGQGWASSLVLLAQVRQKAGRRAELAAGALLAGPKALGDEDDVQDVHLAIRIQVGACRALGAKLPAHRGQVQDVDAAVAGDVGGERGDGGLGQT